MVVTTYKGKRVVTSVFERWRVLPETAYRKQGRIKGSYVIYMILL